MDKLKNSYDLFVLLNELFFENHMAGSHLVVVVNNHINDRV